MPALLVEASFHLSRKMEKKLQIYAVLPALKDEVGHIYSYNLALEKAASFNGWKYSALVPYKCRIKNLPLSWEKGLYSTDWEKNKNFFDKFTPFKNLIRFFRFLKKANHAEAIVFLEHFTLVDLGVLFLACLFIRPKFQFWLLHRYASSQMKGKGRLHNIIHRLFKLKIGKRFFKLMTDSELLQKDLKAAFGQEVHLVSIPHGGASGSVTGQSKKISEPIKIWWPGGSIRPEKGLFFIQTLTREHELKDCQLIVSEGCRPFLKETGKVEFLPRHLTGEEYDLWMQKADFVILPYDPKIYAFGTSGIFVEAVIAGSCPLASDGTWMAYELKKFGLEKLIFQRDKIMDLDFQALKADPQILQKLSDMRKSYLAFHNIGHFANLLQRISL